MLFLPLWKVAAQFPSTESPPSEAPGELRTAIEKSKPDTSRISLLLKLGRYYLSKDGVFVSDLDSAHAIINTASQLSNKLAEVDWQYKALLLTGVYYVEAGDLAHGKQYLDRVITHYHRTGNVTREAEAWEKLGDLFANNGKFGHEEERLVFFKRARSLYLQNHKPVNATHVLTKIAEIHLADAHYELSEKELWQALVEYKGAGYKKLQETYDLLYTIEYGRGNYYRAIGYASEGIKAMKVSGDSALASRLYRNIAHTNFIVGKYSDALEWLRKAIIADKNAYTLRCVLIQTLLELNKTEEARAALNELSKIKRTLTLDEELNRYRVNALYFRKINNYDQAVQYNLEVLKLAQKKDVGPFYYNIWNVLSNNEIAGIYLKNDQPKKAEKYIRNVASILKNTTSLLDPRNWVIFYNNSYKYNLAIGNYQAALKNLEQHDKLRDSLFTADKDKQIAELNIQYQTAQKEQSIKDLHSQSSIQQARVETANLQRNITIGGVVVLLVLTGVAYNAYRQKQRSNLQLQAKQRLINSQNAVLQKLVTEKDWLLKEVHHRVKNNLHTVICLLEAQARYLESDALKAIENSQHRIYAMSLIHQKLYQSDDIKTIDMSVYIPELVRSLEESFDSANQIRFTLNIHPIDLTISHAIPVGLIINEAVTNSIKYAFPDNRKGEISISMTDNGEWIKLELADNGIGMPQMDMGTEPESLGLRLMKGLCEDIDADINFEINNGTKISIVFKPDALNDVESFSNSSGTVEA